MLHAVLMLERQMKMKLHHLFLTHTSSHIWPKKCRCGPTRTQKIVISEEETYETCVTEFYNREYKGWAEYKRFMMDKYYVSETLLDMLLKEPEEDEAEGCEGGGGDGAK